MASDEREYEGSREEYEDWLEAKELAEAGEPAPLPDGGEDAPMRAALVARVKKALAKGKWNLREMRDLLRDVLVWLQSAPPAGGEGT